MPPSKTVVKSLDRTLTVSTKKKETNNKASTNRVIKLWGHSGHDNISFEGGHLPLLCALVHTNAKNSKFKQVKCSKCNYKRIHTLRPCLSVLPIPTFSPFNPRVLYLGLHK